MVERSSQSPLTPLEEDHFLSDLHQKDAKNSREELYQRGRRSTKTHYSFSDDLAEFVKRVEESIDHLAVKYKMKREAVVQKIRSLSLFRSRRAASKYDAYLVCLSLDFDDPRITDKTRLIELQQAAKDIGYDNLDDDIIDEMVNMTRCLRDFKTTSPHEIMKVKELDISNTLKQIDENLENLGHRTGVASIRVTVKTRYDQPIPPSYYCDAVTEKYVNTVLKRDMKELTMTLEGFAVSGIVSKTDTICTTGAIVQQDVDAAKSISSDGTASETMDVSEYSPTRNIVEARGASSNINNIATSSTAENLATSPSSSAIEDVDEIVDEDEDCADDLDDNGNDSPRNVTYTTIGSASGTLRATIEAAITGPGIRIINIQNTAGIGTVKNAKNIRCALLRGEIRKLVNVGLREITGRPELRMSWKNYERDIVKLNHVRLKNWPVSSSIDIEPGTGGLTPVGKLTEVPLQNLYLAIARDRTVGWETVPSNLASRHSHIREGGSSGNKRKRNLTNISTSPSISTYEACVGSSVNKVKQLSSSGVVMKSVIRERIDKGLREITGKPELRMSWDCYEDDIVNKYHVRLMNWPISFEYASKSRAVMKITPIDYIEEQTLFDIYKGLTKEGRIKWERDVSY